MSEDGKAALQKVLILGIPIVFVALLLYACEWILFGHERNIQPIDPDPEFAQRIDDFEKELIRAARKVPDGEIIEAIYQDKGGYAYFTFCTLLKEGTSEDQAKELASNLQQLLDETVQEIKNPPLDNFTIGFSIDIRLTGHPDWDRKRVFRTIREYGSKAPNTKWKERPHYY